MELQQRYGWIHANQLNIRLDTLENDKIVDVGTTTFFHM